MDHHVQCTMYIIITINHNKRIDLVSNDGEHDACAENPTCASCASWFETNKSKSCPPADGAAGKSAPDTAVFVHLLLPCCYWGLPLLPPTLFPSFPQPCSPSTPLFLFFIYSHCGKFLVHTSLSLFLFLTHQLIKSI